MRAVLRLLCVFLILSLLLPVCAEDCLCTQMQIPIEDCTHDDGVAPTESSSGRTPNYFCPSCGRLLYSGEEIPPLASNQEAVSEPEPVPQPEPEPEPEPAPAPVPEPEPEPVPAPAPEPEPAPAPEPEPAPAPKAEPQPAVVNEAPVTWSSQSEPAAPATQDSPVAPATQSEPESSGRSLPPVPSVQQPTASDLAYVEAKRREEAEAVGNSDRNGSNSAGSGQAAPGSRAGRRSLFFPYRHYLLKPVSGIVCPHAGILLWSSTLQNEPGGLFASYAN